MQLHKRGMGLLEINIERGLEVKGEGDTQMESHDRLTELQGGAVNG